MTTVYKVLSGPDWSGARASGAYRGSADDLRDGFIHFSTAAQLPETLRKHFAAARGLVLLWVDTEAVEGWRWETSRGGALFPHLYAELPVSAVRRSEALAIGPDGSHELPVLE